MRTTLAVIATVFFAIQVIPQSSAAREKKENRFPITIQDDSEAFVKRTPARIGGPLRASAVLETTWLASYNFDSGANCVPEGWTSVDLSAQVDDYWHVDDFALLGGGSFGRLVALEGNQSMWCGTRPGPDPTVCAYSTPGYGNSWDQSLCTDTCIVVSGSVKVDYLVTWDSEPGYDYSYLQFDECDGDWRDFDPIVEYNYIGGGFESHTLSDSLHAGQIRIRFNFTSDAAWSDHDGLWETDGAIIVDSLTVSDGTGVVVATELFEDEAPGDKVADDWLNCNAVGYGDFAGLYPGINHVQKDPCDRELTCVWDFVQGSVYNFDCGGYPTQAVVPYVNAHDQYIDNSIQSPEIPLLGEGTSLIFSWDIYLDLPLENLVLYTIGFNTVEDGCPQAWFRLYTLIYSTSPRWGRGRSADIGFGLGPATTGVQVELRVRDMCHLWCGHFGSGDCHSNAPLIDNVELYRVTTSGPDISCWNFHDAFATDGTLTGTVRADQGRDVYEYTDPEMEFEDELWVTASDPFNGLEADPYTGFGSAVYCYVTVNPQNQPGKTGSALTDDALRWPVVDSLTYDGDTWYKIRTDTFFYDPVNRLQPADDYFTVDLNDNLFTPGDTVFYIVSAQSAAPASIVNYFSDVTGAVPDFTAAADQPNWFTCLPAGGYLRGGDILLVDQSYWRSRGHFDTAFDMLGIEDKVDRYVVWAPSSGLPNSLAGKCVDVLAQLVPCYRKIIWSAGGMTLGTVGDGVNRKTDDFALLQTFLDNLPQTGGVYFTGDNIAEEWQGMSAASAVTFRSSYMNFDYISGDHVDHGLGYSPLVIGEAGSMFDHTLGPDTSIAYGGCPGPVSRFDVIAPTGTSVLEASYGGGGATDGAILSQRTTNGLGQEVGVVLQGYRYDAIRDDRAAGVPDRAEQLRHIIEWLGNVLDEPVGTDPATYQNTLAQNRPNPFNPVTTIEYSVKQSGPVTLRVYNVAGQLVRTLVDETREAGVMHKIEWKGRNDAGQSVSSGIYFYKLVAKNYAETRKMVLLK